MELPSRHGSEIQSHALGVVRWLFAVQGSKLARHDEQILTKGDVVVSSSVERAGSAVDPVRQ
jgi:hypothetical protein